MINLEIIRGISKLPASITDQYVKNKIDKI
jgi:hypothetical protein